MRRGKVRVVFEIDAHFAALLPEPGPAYLMAREPVRDEMSGLPVCYLGRVVSSVNLARSTDPRDHVGHRIVMEFAGGGRIAGARCDECDTELEMDAARLSLDADRATDEAAS